MSHYIYINIILCLIIIIFLCNKKVFIEKFIQTTTSNKNIIVLTDKVKDFIGYKNNVTFSSDTRSKCFDCDKAMPLKAHGHRCFDCEKEIISCAMTNN